MCFINILFVFTETSSLRILTGPGCYENFISGCLLWTIWRALLSTYPSQTLSLLQEWYSSLPLPLWPYPWRGGEWRGAMWKEGRHSGWIMVFIRVLTKSGWIGKGGQKRTYGIRGRQKTELMLAAAIMCAQWAGSVLGLPGCKGQGVLWMFPVLSEAWKSDVIHEAIFCMQALVWWWLCALRCW